MMMIQIGIEMAVVTDSPSVRACWFGMTSGAPRHVAVQRSVMRPPRLSSARPATGAPQTADRCDSPLLGGALTIHHIISRSVLEPRPPRPSSLPTCDRWPASQE